CGDAGPLRKRGSHVSVVELDRMGFNSGVARLEFRLLQLRLELRNRSMLERSQPRKVIACLGVRSIRSRLSEFPAQSSYRFNHDASRSQDTPLLRHPRCEFLDLCVEQFKFGLIRFRCPFE